MFYFISCSIIWGLTWIAIKYQFQSVDSAVAVFYRFICASALLFAFVLIKKIPLRFNKERHLSFAAQGFFMFCLNYLLTYKASQMAPSALIALAFTSLIYFNMFGAKIFHSVAVDPKVFIGATVSFFGMALITYNELSGANLNSNLGAASALGFLIGLISTLSASAGNLLSMKRSKNGVSISANNAWGMLYGSIFTLIYCLITKRSFAVHDINSDFIISFVYLTVFGTVLSFGAYLKLIESMGPSKAAFTSVISPVIAVGVSVYFENLQISFLLAAGIILSLCGNVVALWPKNLLKIKQHVH